MVGISYFKYRPSMTANTDFDFRLKCGLLDDVFTIVDI